MPPALSLPGSSAGSKAVLTICSRSTPTCSPITCSIVPGCAVAIQRIIAERNSSFR